MPVKKKKKTTVKKKTVARKKVAPKKKVVKKKKKAVKKPAKMGRPTIFCKKLAEEVINRILDGESVNSICKDERMPNRSNFYRWFHKETDDKVLLDFRNNYVSAKAFAAEMEADEMLDIADNQVEQPLLIEGVPLTIGENNKLVMIKDQASINHAALRINTRKWTVEKLLPKKFGTKLDVTSTEITKVIIKDMSGKKNG